MHLSHHVITCYELFKKQQTTNKLYIYMCEHILPEKSMCKRNRYTHIKTQKKKDCAENHAHQIHMEKKCDCILENQPVSEEIIEEIIAQIHV